MPETPIYQLPYEQFPSGTPGTTLYGGPSGNDPILAEAVEDELERVDSAASALQSTVDAIIPTGLTTIGTATETANFTIAVPSGEFRSLRLWMTGNLDGTGIVLARINAELTTDLHQSAFRLYTANSGTFVESVSGMQGTRYRIARWGSLAANASETWWGDCHGPSRIPMMSRSIRQGGEGAGAQFYETWGRLAANRLVESIQIQAVDGAFESCRWVLQGVPA